MKKLIVLMAAMMTFATTAFAQLGSSTTDLVYTPITPCRVLDTRPSQGGTGPISAAGTKHFQIWGAASYAAQGGKASNCGITAGANVAAVAMNVTVVTPAAGGFVTAYPFGAALPTAATVNFQAGDIARGDFTIAKVTQTGTSHLSIYSTSNADVVGDVVGFYSKPISAGSMTCRSIGSYATIPAGYEDTSVATETCAANEVAVAPYCYRPPNQTYVYSTGSGVDYQGSYNAFCSWLNTSGSSRSVYNGVRCCSIPGR